MQNRPKIIKLIWWIPHYRVPVFRRLSQNPDLDFTVCAGDNSLNFGGEKVASASDVGSADGVNWRRLDSRRLKMPPFRRYEWQPEAVRIAWRDDIDAVISLGNKSLSNWLVRCRSRQEPLVFFLEQMHQSTEYQGSGNRCRVDGAREELSNV
jgi:hypothetical protein